MKKNTILLLLCLPFAACTHTTYKTPHVLLNTFYGEVEIELYPDKAPKTVAAFLKYVDSGYYKNSSFYRLLGNENLPPEYNNGLVQGGIFKTDPTLLDKLPGIVLETTKQTGLLHTSGTISLARTTANSANTEFFICVGDQPQFNADEKASGDGLGFAAFGKVVKGMDIIRKIQNTPSHADSFDTPVKIDNIERL